MRKETMTPKERWLAIVNREEPDRIPLYYRATGEATEKLMKYMGCRNTHEMFHQLHIDRVSGVGARYIGPSIKSGEDMYGCRRKSVRYEGGTYS